MLRVAGPNRWNEHSIVNVEDGNPNRSDFRAWFVSLQKKQSSEKFDSQGLSKLLRVRNSIYSSMRVNFFLYRSGANVRCRIFFPAYMIIQHCKRPNSLTK